ncbi:RNA helicase [Sarracenia purpurea var. burkii]
MEKEFMQQYSVRILVKRDEFLEVNWLTRKMRSNNNISVSSKHGDMPQKERNAMMEKFRDVNTRFLITTDGWARRLDVEQACILVMCWNPSKCVASVVYG